MVGEASIILSCLRKVGCAWGGAFKTACWCAKTIEGVWDRK